MNLELHPPFEGDGGKDIKIAALAPAGQDVSKEDEWLLPYIQGMLNSNLKQFSNMTIIDRQYIDTIIAEQNRASSGSYSEKDYIGIGKLTNAQYILTGTVQKIPNNQYSIRLSIINVGTGEVRASLTKNADAAQLQNGSFLNGAASGLLSQMGVRLTSEGERLLSGGQDSAVKAETATAKGIAAQKNGAVTEALAYYSQASALSDSPLTEADGRLMTLLPEAGGGNIGQVVLSNIEYRRAWLNFFTEHPPFEIVHDSKLTETTYTNSRSLTTDRAASAA